MPIKLKLTRSGPPSSGTITETLPENGTLNFLKSVKSFKTDAKGIKDSFSKSAIK